MDGCLGRLRAEALAAAFVSEAYGADRFPQLLLPSLEGLLFLELQITEAKDEWLPWSGLEELFLWSSPRPWLHWGSSHS